MTHSPRYVFSDRSCTLKDVLRAYLHYRQTGGAIIDWELFEALDNDTIDVANGNDVAQSFITPYPVV